MLINFKKFLEILSFVFENNYLLFLEVFLAVKPR